jgi:flagellar biosynthesis protein FlhG
MTTLPPPVIAPSERVRQQDDQAARLRAMVETMGAASRSETVRPAAPPPAPVRHPGPRAKVIAISSGKGGVGKTNLSVNLAIAMAGLGQRTTLLDADLSLANADLLCGITPVKRLDRYVGIGDGHHPELQARRGGLGELAIEAPGGFKLVPGAAGVSRMADLAPQEQARLLAGVADLERSADLLIIDTAAGLGRDVLSMVRIADLSVIVATPEPTSIADAYALLKCVVVAAKERGAHHLRHISPADLNLAMVVNQAADKKEAKSVHARIAGVCQKFLGYSPSLLGWIAHDRHVGDAVRKRRPFMLEHPRCPASRCVESVATGALATLSPAKAGGHRKAEGLSDLLSRLVLRGR